MRGFMKGIAFAPGHISAFFEPVYSKQHMDRTGSCGAGINISLGAISQVSVQPAFPQRIVVHINGKSSSAVVTKSAVHHLIGNTSLAIRVNTILDLPISQGFGMSAAGALSATLALSDLLSLPRENAIRAAHYAEVESFTGLGDVIASSFGGIEIRKKAGLPPWGLLEHIPGCYDIVLCVISKKIQTQKILTDAAMLRKIASHGRLCMKQLLENPSVEHLVSLGWEFTRKIDIADATVLQALEAANAHGIASMCMLGNSVYAIGDVPRLCKILSSYGTVFQCTIDTKGARVLHEK
jgi:pantoate kinase